MNNILNNFRFPIMTKHGVVYLLMVVTLDNGIISVHTGLETNRGIIHGYRYTVNDQYRLPEFISAFSNSVSAWLKKLDINLTFLDLSRYCRDVYGSLQYKT